MLKRRTPTHGTTTDNIARILSLEPAVQAQLAMITQEVSMIRPGSRNPMSGLRHLYMFVSWRTWSAMLFRRVGLTRSPLASFPAFSSWTSITASRKRQMKEVWR